MGVINVTPDSFSDGGRFLQADLAVAQAAIQLRQGADVLDLGAQSTRPGANEVGAEEELRRLLPPLRHIRERFPDVLISVDTFLAPVAEAALRGQRDRIVTVRGAAGQPYQARPKVRRWLNPS